MDTSTKNKLDDILSKINWRNTNSEPNDLLKAIEEIGKALIGKTNIGIIIVIVETFIKKYWNQNNNPVPVIEQTTSNSSNATAADVNQKENDTPIIDTASSSTTSYVYKDQSFSVVAGFNADNTLNQHVYGKTLTINGYTNKACTATSIAMMRLYSGGSLPDNWAQEWLDNGIWNTSAGIYWERAGAKEVPNSEYNSAQYRRGAILEQITNGNAVAVWVNEKGASTSHHMVCAVGVINRPGIDASNITDADILVVDPDGGGIKLLSEVYTGNRGPASVTGENPARMWIVA